MSKQDHVNPLFWGLILITFFLAFLVGVRPDIEKEYNRKYLIQQEIQAEMSLLDLFKTKQTPKPSFYPLTAENVKEHVDVDFIRTLEGTRCDAYVPMQKGVPLGKSGVTIASGFDLGQRNETDLRVLGFPTTLIAKFKPYLGLKKWDAINYLRNNPLKITQTECNKINDIVFAKEIRGIINEVGEGTWEKLGLSLRTVLTSVQFQYGSARVKTPNFFKKVMSMDVNSVVKHLKNFGDKYTTRRLKEASYLLMSMTDMSGKNLQVQARAEQGNIKNA
jgi:hypothetical protein